MMKKIIMALLVSFLFPKEGTVLIIDNQKFSLHEFFSYYPKKQWERADSLKRDKMFTDFILRKLCILEAKKLGLQNDPDVSIKLRNHSLQILVNESYEQFVAKPLIPSSDIEFARKHAKKELFASHILIAHSGAYLGQPPQRTLDEAFVLSQQIKNKFENGDDFGILAEKYSDDPGVGKNSGSLGWGQWGATVPEFQLVAFILEVGIMSAPVLTDFGYHLILITDTRPSDLQYLSDDAYDYFLENITNHSIIDQLRPAALKYDSLKIEDFRVFFNINAVRSIIKLYDRKQKETSLTGANQTDFVTLLESFTATGIYLPSDPCLYWQENYKSIQLILISKIFLHK